jgi:hypothetical protein
MREEAIRDLLTAWHRGELTDAMRAVLSPGKDASHVIERGVFPLLPSMRKESAFDTDTRLRWGQWGFWKTTGKPRSPFYVTNLRANVPVCDLVHLTSLCLVSQESAHERGVLEIDGVDLHGFSSAALHPLTLEIGPVLPSEEVRAEGFLTNTVPPGYCCETEYRLRLVFEGWALRSLR